MRLLDPSFKYIPSTSTDVAATWRRFGYRPTTTAERTARHKRMKMTVGLAEVAQFRSTQANVARLQPLAIAAKK